MILIWFVNLYVVKRANRSNYIYKLNSDDKILSSLIKRSIEF